MEETEETEKTFIEAILKIIFKCLDKEGQEKLARKLAWHLNLELCEGCG